MTRTREPVTGFAPVRSPFPYAVLDDWFPEGALRRAAAEFPKLDAEGWKRYGNANELKLEGPRGMWGPWTRLLFDLIETRTRLLEDAFGIGDLVMETVGGGYHLIPPGGYLKVHTDFSRSPRTERYRRLNLLIYLNDDWQDPGGHLELWDEERCRVDVIPEFNRTVIFETSDHSWHGHPSPAARERRSIAAYFFTEAPSPGYRTDQSTVWHAASNVLPGHASSG